MVHLEGVSKGYHRDIKNWEYQNTFTSIKGWMVNFFQCEIKVIWQIQIFFFTTLFTHLNQGFQE